LFSHAEGVGNLSPGQGSHAEGAGTQAMALGSHAEGSSTMASGSYSHAEGFTTTTSGSYSHAEGSGTIASGVASHAEGRSAQALGDYSHAEGFFTIASGSYQHVQGQYNMSSSDQSAFIIGNGLNNSSRSNLIFASGSTFQLTGSLNISGSITGSNDTVVNLSNLGNGTVGKLVIPTTAPASPVHGTMYMDAPGVGNVTLYIYNGNASAYRSVTLT